jgi:hypothetical protein
MEILWVSQIFCSVLSEYLQSLRELCLVTPFHITFEDMTVHVDRVTFKITLWYVLTPNGASSATTVSIRRSISVASTAMARSSTTISSNTSSGLDCGGVTDDGSGNRFTHLCAGDGDCGDTPSDCTVGRLDAYSIGLDVGDGTRAIAAVDCAVERFSYFVGDDDSVTQME